MTYSSIHLAVDRRHFRLVREYLWDVVRDALVRARDQERVVGVELGLLGLDSVPPAKQSITVR